MQGERASRFDKGLAVSASVHAALLVTTLVAFSDANPLPTPREPIAVDIVNSSELDQIMRGEKGAPESEEPEMRAEQQAERVEAKPETPTEQASRDVPVPPPPLRREPDPGEAQERTPPVPTPPPAPPRVAAVPPEPQRRPEPPAPTPPPRPEPPKAEAKPERPAPDKAESVPEPPRRPETAKPAPPPTRLKPPEKKAAEKPKDDKTLFDPVAKLLVQKKLEEQKQAAKSRATDKSQQAPKLDFDNVKQKLEDEASHQGRGARAAERTASLGAPNANANRMSPAQWREIDGLIADQYRECWNRLGIDGQQYIPQIMVSYNRDGSLASSPTLVNPSSDPAHRAAADSALRAVMKCNPLKIPPHLAAFHSEWRGRTLRFDPEEM